MSAHLPDYSYLDEDDTQDGLDDMDLSERDTALVVALPHLDYESQLKAIRVVLGSHREAEKKHAADIEKAAQRARRPVRSGHPANSLAAALEEGSAEQQWIDEMHYSIYQNAVHSMAAVGWIAPFVESIFYQSFRSVECEMKDGLALPSDHVRWQRPAEDQWDCHYVWKNGRRSAHLVNGILQLLDAIDMADHMPDDLRPMLSALFEYRNKMFHLGLEWPLEERQRFDKRLSKWPREWFSKATSGGTPWVFYMSPAFIVHCLDRTEDIIAGIGRFFKERFR